MTYQEQLKKAIELKRQGFHEKASSLLDELASAILYNENYNKQNLNVALYCIKAIKRRRGAGVATFAAMKVREDREQQLCVSLNECFFDIIDFRKVDDEKATSATSATSATLVNLIKSNKKLLKALVKNASAQYVNRLLANDPALCHLQAKGQKLKNFFKSNSSLFFE